MRAYEAIADAFVAEGVEDLFVLMGDGNMHVASAAIDRGIRCIHLRHEHSACASASSYATSRGTVGVASVTHGPGFTQIMTALMTAVHARIPLVVFAGETPMGRWNNQGLDQAAFATAAGVPYLAAHRPEDALQVVHRGFDIARHERRPVVIAMPSDLQQAEIDPPPYEPSKDISPPITQTDPAPEAVKALAEKIKAAQRPLVLVGKGAMAADALPEARELADRSGALLGVTLLAKGALEDHPFSLGVIGGYGSPLVQELGKECDLVVALGAGLNTFTLNGGRLFPNATVAQVDLDPRGSFQGLPPVDLRIRGDCKATLAGVIKELELLELTPADWRSDELAEAIKATAAEVAATPIEDGTLDPYQLINRMGEVIPGDWEVVSGAGHSAFFTSRIRGREPGRFTTIRHFGAVGNGLAYAIGVAAAQPDSDVVLFEGDGALLMHIQELEAIRRHGLKMLICVLNDGGYGSEVHVLRADGLDPSIAMFGREDFARVAEGFGLSGRNVTDLDQLPDLLREYQAGDRAEIWNFQISDRVTRGRQSPRPGH